MAVVVDQGKNPGEPNSVRLATALEIELWNTVTKRLNMPLRESYIRVNEQDLIGVLVERDQLRKQLSALERENRELKGPPSTPRSEPSEPDLEYELP